MTRHVSADVRRAIRDAFEVGASRRDLAYRFGLSRSGVSAIVQGLIPIDGTATPPPMVIAVTAPTDASGWEAQAACREAPDPDVFFSDWADSEAIAEAKAYCAICPVVEACRRTAERERHVGVWGGVYRGDRVNRKSRAAA